MTLGCLSVWTAFLDLAHLDLTYTFATASSSLLHLDLACSHLLDALSPVTGGPTWDMSIPLQPGLALGFSSL